MKIIKLTLVFDNSDNIEQLTQQLNDILMSSKPYYLKKQGIQPILEIINTDVETSTSFQLNENELIIKE